MDGGKRMASNWEVILTPFLILKSREFNDKFYSIQFCFFLSATGVLNSQNITGHVQDSLSVPISYASVVATSCQDDQVLAFTNTDEKGRFQLTVVKTDCDSFTLTARSIGYRSVSFRLAMGAQSTERDFILASKVLEEVMVRGKTPPVIARNDTTEYNAASFSDSTEVSVEDLLKKIPGVRVAENGLITYNGKNVERVMIEGDDLFSQNYTLATRNIRADMISKVQVIDRFQENPLMKGIQESDRMVMNLKIKPERKRTLSGNVELGSGYGDEWKGRAHTNLFSLSRKDKIYLIGNVNNSGDNVLSDVEWTAGGGFQGLGKQQTLQSNPLQVRSALPIQPLDNAGLPPIYTQANRSGLLYLGFVLPSSPTFKTKISGWAGEVGLRQESGNSTHYLLGADTIDISENRFVKKRSKTYNVQIESEYFPANKKHAFRGFVKGGSKPIQYDFNLLRSQTGSEDFQVLSQSRQRAFDISGSFEYTLKQRESSAFQIISKTAWHQGCYELLPQYDWYASFFGLDSSFNQLRQTAQQNQGESLFMGRWLARQHSIQWQAEAGLDWNWGQLESDVALINKSGEQWKPGAEYQNDAFLQTPRYFANISATRNFRVFSIRTRLGTSYRPIRFESAESFPITPKLWTAEPRLDMRYNLSEHAALSSYYGFQQDVPDIADLRPAIVFSNYQLTSRGLPNLAIMPGHQAGMHYRYNNRLRQFAWNIGGNMARNQNQFGTQYQISPFLTIQEKFRPVNRLAYSLIGGADRYVRKIRSRFEVGFGLSFLKEEAKLNSETPTKLSQNLYSVNLGYGTAFDTWVNVVLSSRAAQIVGHNDTGGPTTRSTNWFSTAQINIRPSKVFDFKIYLHQVANRAGANPYSIAYASDCVAYLRLKKWRSTVAFSAVNLLRAKQYEQVLADAFSQTTSRVIAVQRFFLLSWELSF